MKLFQLKVIYEFLYFPFHAIQKYGMWTRDIGIIRKK